MDHQMDETTDAKSADHKQESFKPDLSLLNTFERALWAFWQGNHRWAHVSVEVSNFRVIASGSELDGAKHVPNDVEFGSLVLLVKNNGILLRLDASSDMKYGDSLHSLTTMLRSNLGITTSRYVCSKPNDFTPQYLYTQAQLAAALEPPKAVVFLGIAASDDIRFVNDTFSISEPFEKDGSRVWLVSRRPFSKMKGWKVRPQNLMLDGPFPPERLDQQVISCVQLAASGTLVLCIEGHGGLQQGGGFYVQGCKNRKAGTDHTVGPKESDGSYFYTWQRLLEIVVKYAKAGLRVMILAEPCHSASIFGFPLPASIHSLVMVAVQSADESWTSTKFSPGGTPQGNRWSQAIHAVLTDEKSRGRSSIFRFGCEVIANFAQSRADLPNEGESQVDQAPTWDSSQLDVEKPFSILVLPTKSPHKTSSDDIFADLPLLPQMESKSTSSASGATETKISTTSNTKPAEPQHASATTPTKSPMQKLTNSTAQTETPNTPSKTLLAAVLRVDPLLTGGPQEGDLLSSKALTQENAQVAVDLRGNLEAYHSSMHHRKDLMTKLVKCIKLSIPEHTLAAIKEHPYASNIERNNMLQDASFRTCLGQIEQKIGEPLIEPISRLLSKIVLVTGPSSIKAVARRFVDIDKAKDVTAEITGPFEKLDLGSNFTQKSVFTADPKS